MGTGGGSGLPENYIIWQERDDTTISGYISQIAADLYLTIVFMWVRRHEFPFVMRLEQPPQEARVDDKMSNYKITVDQDYSDCNSKSTTSSMSKKHFVDDIVRAISAVVEKFQHQQEVANNKVINSLISAVSSTSPKRQDTVFPSKANKIQKLIDKIHSTTNTINVFKKEFEELKKKCKKANNTSEPKKPKVMVTKSQQKKT